MNDKTSNIGEHDARDENQHGATTRVDDTRRRFEEIVAKSRISIALIGLVGAFSSAVFAIWVAQTTFDRGARVDNTFVELRQLQAEIQDVQKYIEAIASQMDAITALPDEAKVGLRLTGVEQRMSTLQAKIDMIETAVVDNPEKAMSIPILRKDLGALDSELRGDIGGLGKEIERIYGFGQWFIGVAVIPIALAVFTVAIGMRQRPKQKE